MSAAAETQEKQTSELRQHIDTAIAQRQQQVATVVAQLSTAAEENKAFLISTF